MLYKTLRDLNLYSSPALNSLVTQAAIDRFVEIEGIVPPQAAIQVKLVEDSYLGWFDPQDWDKLVIAETPYLAPNPSTDDIRSRLPEVIAFTQAAYQTPNTYLWGGTVAPNYDCSGLMQAAFRSIGVQIPRDAYQQEAFLEPIAPNLDRLEPGDLIFFGTPQKATHVGLYLGEGNYIHSSGKAHGRNGIGIDPLSDANPVSAHYFSELRGAGRVIRSYQP